MPTKITVSLLARIGAVMVVLALLIGGMMAFRVRKNAVTQPNAAGQPASANVVSAPVTPTARTQAPSASVTSDGMSDAFRKAKLPSPLSAPSGDPDQAAAELAKRVVAADEQSTAALLTAIRMSGISVHGDNGSLALESVKPGQGIYFDAWEVAATAKLFGEDLQIKLVDLTKAFSTTLPPFKGVAASMFVDGIRAAAQSNSPARRFWGRFIVEVGRQSAQPYDLLAPQLDSATVNLDAIQTLLILRRLTVDIMIRSGGNKATKAGLSSGESFAKGQASLKTAQCRSSVERPTLHDAVCTAHVIPAWSASRKATTTSPARFPNYSPNCWTPLRISLELGLTSFSSCWKSTEVGLGSPTSVRVFLSRMPSSRSASSSRITHASKPTSP